MSRPGSTTTSSRSPTSPPSLRGSPPDRGSPQRTPPGHLVIVGKKEEIDAVRGPSRIVRRLEFYRTHYGPVVRLAFSIYPGSGEPLNGATLLNVAQVSGDTALNRSEER